MTNTEFDMYNRITHKTVAADVQVDELMAFVHYVKVKQITDNEILVADVDHGNREITICGRELIENAYSADQVHETIQVTKTQAAEILVGSVNRPFTVCFVKADGSERMLRGRLIRPEPLLGRSVVEDLATTDVNRIRQVDHRTIQWLIVEGVKYTVK